MIDELDPQGDTAEMQLSWQWKLAVFACPLLFPLLILFSYWLAIGLYLGRWAYVGE